LIVGVGRVVHSCEQMRAAVGIETQHEDCFGHGELGLRMNAVGRLPEHLEVGSKGFGESVKEVGASQKTSNRAPASVGQSDLCVPSIVKDVACKDDVTTKNASLDVLRPRDCPRADRAGPECDNGVFVGDECNLKVMEHVVLVDAIKHILAECIAEFLKTALLGLRRGTREGRKI